MKVVKERIDSEGVDKNSEINPSQEPKGIRSMKEASFYFDLRIEKEKAFLSFIDFEEGKPSKFTSFIRQGTSTQRSNKAHILCFGRNPPFEAVNFRVFPIVLAPQPSGTHLLSLMDHQNAGIIVSKKQN